MINLSFSQAPTTASPKYSSCLHYKTGVTMSVCQLHQTIEMSEGEIYHQKYKSLLFVPDFAERRNVNIIDKVVLEYS